ncbi:MAG: ADP-ribosylglycohydrolase family protein [Clostridia bacterium]
MFGAIIGDIAGSNLEVEEILAKKSQSKISANIRRKVLADSYDIFDSKGCATDDTILTIAVADAILNDGNFEKYIRAYGTREEKLGKDNWGRSRFGGRFVKWLSHENIEPSIGNGASMRVSPIGWAYDTLEITLEMAKQSASCSHDTLEAIKGAQAVAGSIFLARKGKNLEEIRAFAERILIQNLNLNLSELQENYAFNATTFGSVPQAIYCFLISNNFEDSIKKSLSIGGDSDTIAAITGSIAEAYWGVPKEFRNRAKKYLKEEYLKVAQEFEFRYGKKEISNNFTK